MPRKAEGVRPLTPAERQARRRERQAGEFEAMRAALAKIEMARTVEEAREIARAVREIR